MSDRWSVNAIDVPSVSELKDGNKPDRCCGVVLRELAAESVHGSGTGGCT